MIIIPQNVISPFSNVLAMRLGAWRFDLIREGDNLRVDDSFDEVLFVLRGPEFGGSFSLRKPDPFDSNKGTILYNSDTELWELDFFTEFEGVKSRPNIPTGAWVDISTRRLPSGGTGFFDGTWSTQYPRVFDSALKQNTNDLIKPSKFVMTLPHREHFQTAPFENGSNAFSIKNTIKTTIPYDVKYRVTGSVTQNTSIAFPDPKIGEFVVVTTDGDVVVGAVPVFGDGGGSGPIDKTIIIRKGSDGPFQTIDNILRVTGPDVFGSTGSTSILIEMVDSNGSDVTMNLAIAIQAF